MVFIDGSNFYHLCKTSLGTTNIEFGAFANKLCNGRELIEIRYYNAAQNQQINPHAYCEQQKFLARIRLIKNLVVKLGKLKKRPIKCPRCKKIIEKCPLCQDIIFNLVEKNTDVNLAIDIVRLAYENVYDTAIIVTGDGDFSGAVDLARKYKKRIEHARFSFGYSHELNSKCDAEIILEDKFFEGCFLDDAI